MRDGAGKDGETEFALHLLAVRKLLGCLEAAGLTVKPSKCLFFMTIIKYCGHVLCNGERRPSPVKVAAIANWSPEMITKSKHMKSFLGIANWYSIYIQDFATWASPLSDSLQGIYTKGDKVGKGKHKMHKVQDNIIWTPQMLHGFNKIREAIVKEVALYIPTVDGQYQIHTDACDWAIGAVLEQLDPEGRWRTVAFFSRKLQGSPGKGQWVWSVREKETYALVCALFKFRSWIQSSTVTVPVWTDHESIQHWYKEDLCSISGPIGRRGRWHEFLSKFNIVVQYMKGENNVVADAMSRWAYPAGTADDVTFHGAVQDEMGWDKDEELDREADTKVFSIVSKALSRVVHYFGGFFAPHAP